MEPENKACERCGSLFYRPKKYSQTQWGGKRFCSRRCSAIKHSISVDEISRLYKEKFSGEEIGKKFGVSSTHIRRILKKNGVIMRSNGEPQRLAMRDPEVKLKLSRASTGRKHSVETKQRMSSIFGDRHPLWRGGITKLSSGYLMYTNSPQNKEYKNKFVHQVVAKIKYGRWALSSEHIHHVDGNKLNNHPDNLLLMSASAHAKLHALQRK